MHLTAVARKSIQAAAALGRHSAFTVNGHAGEAVFLDVSRTVSIRTVRELLVLFQLAGKHVYLGARGARWSLSIARSLHFHRNTTLLWRNLRSVHTPLVCSDAPNMSFRDLVGCRQLIRVCYDYGPQLCPSVESFPLPMPMHSQLYVEYGDHERLDTYRTNRRKIRIAFAGNVSHGYQSRTVRETYHKLDRFEIVDFLTRMHLARQVTSAQELDALLEGPYRHEFVIINPDVRIHQSAWMRFLSQVDFFLCPPGLMVPRSHNTTEAMAVGTVPLINYPDWFFPNLTHGENSMIFSTLSDLRERIVEILSMSGERIEAIRRQVIKYYDAHLCLKRFINRILTCDRNTVYLHTLSRTWTSG